jgi:hypothetical protein
MSRVFQAHGRGIRAQFEPQEVELLRTLEQGVSQTLEYGDDTDPVIERLFPTAVVGDDDADAELRRLLRDELLGSRRDGLRALVEILDRARPHRGRLRVDLVDDEPLLVLGVLNDLRLAIGARIGIEHLDREDIPDDDALAYRLAVMDHLGWWQEQLLVLLHQPDDANGTDDHGDWP